MQVRNINWPEEKDAIADHIREVHGPGDKDFLMKWYGSYPDFDPADCFVIEGDNGEIAAHTMIIPRILQIGVAHIPTGEIGVVGTMDRYRGRGYANTLMARALDRMTERGDALGLILGIPNFYERWDFEYAVGLYLTSYESSIYLDRALTADAWDMTHSHQRRTAAFLGMKGREAIVRPFYSDDLETITALYEAECAKGHYIVARDQKTWAWQLYFLDEIGRHDPEGFLVAEIDNHIVGYVRVVTQGQVNWFLGNEAARFSIIESAGDDPDGMEVLLGAAARLARDYDAERLGVFVHPQSQLMRHVLAHGGLRRDFTGAGYLRLHNLPMLMGLLTPTFEGRLLESRFADRAFQLHVAVEEAEMSMPVGRGMAELVDVHLEIPATDLVRLVTGWFGVEDISPDCYDELHKDFWRVLFPKGDPRVGMADVL